MQVVLRCKWRPVGVDNVGQVSGGMGWHWGRKFVGGRGVVDRDGAIGLEVEKVGGLKEGRDGWG